MTHPLEFRATVASEHTRESLIYSETSVDCEKAEVVIVEVAIESSSSLSFNSCALRSIHTRYDLDHHLPHNAIRHEPVIRAHHARAVEHVDRVDDGLDCACTGCDLFRLWDE